MGLGVMFTLSVYLIQHSLIDEIIQTAPPGVPNVYLVGVTLEQSAPLKQLDLQRSRAFSPRRSYLRRCPPGSSGSMARTSPRVP